MTNIITGIHLARVTFFFLKKGNLDKQVINWTKIRIFQCVNVVVWRCGMCTTCSLVIFCDIPTISDHKVKGFCTTDSLLAITSCHCAGKYELS